jgi:hypothetical protein
MVAHIGHHSTTMVYTPIRLGDPKESICVSKRTQIPHKFGTAFLQWLRNKTEAAWALHRPSSVQEIAQEFVQTGMMGCQWQRGTRWMDGLSQAEISRVEWKWDLHFPPDYRLFLQHLNTLDRPLLCPTWRAEIRAVDVHLPHVPVGHEHGFQEGFLVLVEEQHFTNWLVDDAVQVALMQIERAVLSSNEAGENRTLSLPEHWHTAWGADPGMPDARRARIRELLATAPRLIPIMTGHYLLAEPSRAGNPVFMIPHPPAVPTFEVVAPDLRAFFLDRFATMLGVDGERIERRFVKVLRERAALYAAIPFWGALLSPLRWP